MFVRFSTFLAGALLTGVMSLAGAVHDHAEGGTHVHMHSHDGYRHAHAHSHSNSNGDGAHGPEEPGTNDSPGDHHECADGHDERTAPPSTTAMSNARRVSLSECVQLTPPADGASMRPECPELAAPEHPPPRLTSQDPLPQLRTIVLLT